MPLFDIIFYQPLLNILILFYQYLPGHDFGISIILLTILIRILLYPLGVKTIRSQKIFQGLQSKIKEIQRKYKDDKEKQLQATMDLYREAKINPFSSFLPLLIQLPILFALYRVFWKGFNMGETIYLYKFIPRPESINPAFLRLINLDKPYFLLAILSGVLQFFQIKMMEPVIKKGEELDKFSNMLQKQTLYFFPVLLIIMFLKAPSAICLYWITSTIFSIIQQYFILKSYAKQK